MSPTFRRERDALAAQLSDEAPRVRAMRAEANLAEDHYSRVQGVREGPRGRGTPAPLQETVEQGYAMDLPARELSPRQQFLQATPEEQLIWIDSYRNRERGFAPLTPAQGNVTPLPSTAPARGLRGGAPPPQPPQPAGGPTPAAGGGSMPPMRRQFRKPPERATAADIVRRAGTRPAGDTLAQFAEAHGITPATGRGAIKANAEAIRQAALRDPRIMQAARDAGLLAVLMSVLGASGETPETLPQQ